MYLSNKYSIWYYSIISNAKSKLRTEYTESHHIIPRSLGGSNDPSNLVELTAKEHFICHKLLTKFTTGEAKRKMLYAYRCLAIMTTKYQQRYIITSSEFEKLRKLGLRSGKITSEETKLRISIANTGKTPWNKGISRTDEEKQKISETRKARSSDSEWNIRQPCSQETANKISIANTGKRWVTNGIIAKQLNPDEAALLCAEGWRYGRR